jgi:hypothetical protein
MGVCPHGVPMVCPWCAKSAMITAWQLLAPMPEAGALFNGNTL